MFEKFNHKFKGNRHYNFFIVCVGLFFATFLILPEDWRRPAPLALAFFISSMIAKFASSNPSKQQKPD